MWSSGGGIAVGLRIVSVPIAVALVENRQLCFIVKI